MLVETFCSSFFISPARQTTTFAGSAASRETTQSTAISIEVRMVGGVYRLNSQLPTAFVRQLLWLWALGFWLLARPGARSLKPKAHVGSVTRACTAKRVPQIRGCRCEL